MRARPKPAAIGDLTKRPGQRGCSADELRAGLPEGVEIVTVYDRSELIRSSVANLVEKLWMEFLIVALVCAVFLLHFGAGGHHRSAGDRARGVHRHGPAGHHEQTVRDIPGTVSAFSERTGAGRYLETRRAFRRSLALEWILIAGILSVTAVMTGFHSP